MYDYINMYYHMYYLQQFGVSWGDPGEPQNPGVPRTNIRRFGSVKPITKKKLNCMCAVGKLPRL